MNAAELFNFVCERDTYFNHKKFDVREKFQTPESLTLIFNFDFSIHVNRIVLIVIKMKLLLLCYF